MTSVVVGAGPYGLSIAAHLHARGVPVRIFGDVMASWRNMTPAGMCLKSAPWASSLGAPQSGLTLADFESATGIPQLREDQVVPVEQFIRYGEWFAEELSRVSKPASCARSTSVAADSWSPWTAAR